jgi:DNA-binding NarL/FixJ family response regulator
VSEAIRVMIVDDERLFAELLRVAMRNAGDIDVVAVAHDVRSAIAALEDARPTSLADYHLPDGTGADLARALRSSRPSTAIGAHRRSERGHPCRRGTVGRSWPSHQRARLQRVVAVRAAAAGEVLFSPSELQRLLPPNAAILPARPSRSRHASWRCFTSSRAARHAAAAASSGSRRRPCGRTSRRSCASLGALAPGGGRGGRTARPCHARFVDAAGPDLPAWGESPRPWRLTPHAGGSIDA